MSCLAILAYPSEMAVFTFFRPRGRTRFQVDTILFLSARRILICHSASANTFNS